ncbi:MAG: type II secretion system F family protein [Myxococcota bacterium]
MPVFEYRGVTAGNRSARGWVDAESPRLARQKLRAEGIYPTDLREGRVRSRLSDALDRLKLPQLRRVPDLELALFSRQLATLVAAGLPLVEALGALTDQLENERLKAVVGQVRETVNEGSSLTDAMGAHALVFGDLYCAMVRAGESSGSLEVVLRRLGDYIERQMELRNEVIQAMIYPAIMVLASLAVAGVLLVKVIPTITALLRGLDQELPLATVIVIAASDFLIRWWATLGIGGALAFLAFQRAIRTERGRMAWDRLRMRLPVVGRSVRYVAISRFARTLATLLAGGLPIVRGLDIAGQVSGNAVIRAAVDRSRESILGGSSIAGPLRQSGEFPPMVTHMISVGEASGELDTMLARLADTYDDLVKNSLKRMTALMGPILLLMVAGLVVTIIVSTLLPLLNLTAAL